ncbi:HNH endonuclease [Roseomonas sp. E05]|uniref:HNH endonuclease n=1 Tax=Roseomonas sp. E05 TaxID=3046310 RepID=UPI0024BB3137|nr:HNH endonuclease [Roseomonas sp. E05]MDJ0391079.1 HNH endonuclease [Roseomonas sp. E05]
MSELVRRFEADPAGTTALWRLASHKAAQIGDRVYLFKQGTGPKGIFGVGDIVGPPSMQPDPDDIEGGLTYRATIRFTQLVDPLDTFLLDFSTIQDLVPTTLIAIQSSGTAVPSGSISELERLLAPVGSAGHAVDQAAADDPAFDPDSQNDLRDRAIRSIRVRRGQPAFRNALLEAYGGRCAITGCAVEDVLEAAHITPYLGAHTNYVWNGLLLRTDLHTLFDCGLLSIEPKRRTVVVADALRASSYGKLAGKLLRIPKDPAKGPSRRSLEARYRDFVSLQTVSRKKPIAV